VKKSGSIFSLGVGFKMLDSKIPILSIREPYATLIIEGKKDIELRNWKPPAWAKEFYIHVPTIADLEKCREYNIIPNPPRTIIGKATITDVKYYNTPNEFAKDYPRHYHKLFWKYNYGFILDNLEKIQPIYDIPGKRFFLFIYSLLMS
jgi:hypothetical protein